jgi:DNA replication protein DnaC
MQPVEQAVVNYSKGIKKETGQRHSAKPVVECDVCDDIHWVTHAVPVGHPDFGKAFTCLACEGGREKQRKKMQRLIPGIGMHDYSRYTFQSWDDEIPDHKKNGKEIARAMVEFAIMQKCKPWCLNDLYDLMGYEHVERGYVPRAGIVLSGTNGMGKTGLMAGLANECPRLPKEVAFVRVSQVVDAIKDSWSNPARRELEIIKALVEVECLILDEMGTPQKASATTVEKITEIVRQRSMQSKPYFITTNHRTRDSFKAEFGSQAAAVILHECHWENLEGGDLRTIG